MGSGGGARPSPPRKRHHRGDEITGSLIIYGYARQLSPFINVRGPLRGRCRARDGPEAAATDRITISAERLTRDERQHPSRIEHSHRQVAGQFGRRIGLLGQVDRAGAIDRHIIRGVTRVRSNRVRSEI